MRKRNRLLQCTGVFMGVGLLAGCVTGREEPAPGPDQMPVITEASAPGAVSTLTGEGPVQHTYNCPPAAEVDQPGAPSVEVGVTTPVPSARGESKGDGTKVYTRYNCN